MNQIQVENLIANVVRQVDLQVGLMIADQRNRCASGECDEEFYELGFGQSPFHITVVTGDG